MLKIGETISDRSSRLKGFTSGFDYLRIVLAIAVVIVHSPLVAYGGPVNDRIVWDGWQRIVPAPILIMFFALSGFLVAGSLQRRPSLASFATLRALRLVPALAVEIVLTALILGPLVTSLPVGEYLSNRQFFRYFKNVFGLITFELPGVFLDNPFPAVANLSLWTIPLELDCYLLLVVLYLIGAFQRRHWLIVAVAAILVAGTTSAFLGDRPFWLDRNLWGRALILAFISGVAINLYSDRIRLDWRYALASGVLASLLVLDRRAIVAIAPLLAYVTVYLGMLNPPRRSFLLSGDYSYGLYLFAFPIQQFLALSPALRHWYLNASIAVALGLVYAAFSWFVVEKPLLNRKRDIVGFVERVIDVVLARLPAVLRKRLRADPADREAGSARP